MRRRGSAFLAWCGVLAVGLTWLHHVGPTLQSGTPEATAMAAVRTAGLMVGWYLAVATAVGAGARLVGTVRAVRVADLVVPPSLRQLLNATVGASLAVASTAPAAWASTTVEEPPPATIRLLPDGHGRRDVRSARTVEPSPPTTIPPTTSTSSTSSSTTTTGSPVEEQSTPPPPAPAAMAEPAPPPDPSLPAAVPAPVPVPPVPDGSTWTVAGGEHFWSIAEHVLAAAWHRPPSDGEIDPYWRSLVDANRSRLRDPKNPDLLFAGQVLAVPRPPPPPP